MAEETPAQKLIRVLHPLVPACVVLSILILALSAEPVTLEPKGNRPYVDSSYWNRPLPPDAPISEDNDVWIADSLDPDHTQNYLRLPGVQEGGGEPIYYSDADDPVQRVCAESRSLCFKVHVPPEAAPAATSDATLQIYDLATDQVVGMYDAARTSDGKLVHGGVDRYYLSGDGVDESVGGTEGNFGHRGIPASVRALRYDEILAGGIDHRLECFWHATAEKHYWPMTAHETDKGGIVPQGVVIRIKPEIDLASKSLMPAARVIARALQRYGCIIGDNSGSSNTMKVEQANWWGTLTTDALRSIPFSEWEFMKGGYRPPTRSAAPGSERADGKG